MKSKLLFIITSALALLAACSNDDTDMLFPEYTSSQALLSDVTVSLMEQTQTTDTIQAEEEGIYLYIETTAMYPYSNFGILRSTFQEGDTLIIRLEDLIKPSVSLAPNGPASTSVKVPENTRHIVFLRGHDNDRFELIIEEDAFVLQPLQTSFVEPNSLIFIRE